uniref:Double zinc ribbon and ankyrin repeat domains 1 n=1 Tax=Salmo trutta TaxID=8032 RepID=A0A673YTC6_SALTR
MTAGCIVHEIDTTTPVEIKSDKNMHVTIYYTLDGTKPEVTKRPGFGENSTLKYSGPICLPEDKVSVKALAITRDGRESAIVTKLFLVEYVPSNEPPSTEDNEENFLKEYERGLPRQSQRPGLGPLLRSPCLHIVLRHWYIHKKYIVNIIEAIRPEGVWYMANILRLWAVLRYNETPGL